MGSQNHISHNQRPQFIQLLLPTAEFLQKLPIPDSIAELLTEEQNETATLFSPLGKFWHITLHKDGDNRLYFDNGWHKFSQFHELVAGDFVLFRYEGNMVFKVKVFDTSGCHKPYDKIVHGIAKKRSIETKDENCDNILSYDRQNLSTSSRKRRKSDFISFPKQQGTEEPHTSPGLLAKKKLAEDKNSTKSLPHFERIIRHYNVNLNLPRVFLSVPKSFRLSHRLFRKKEFILNDPMKRSWPVRIRHGERESRICGGWKEFAVRNNLEEGDICIFQLVSSRVMQVLIRKLRA